MDISAQSNTAVKITLDADEAAALVLTFVDVMTLAKRRTIKGQKYVLLHEKTLDDLIAAVHGVVKTSELAKEQAAS